MNAADLSSTRPRRCGARAARTARRSGRRSDAGFTLIELLVVVGLMGVLAAMAVMIMPGALATARADGGASRLISILRVAREQAIAQRRTVRVTFTNPNRVVVTRVEVPGPGTTVLSDVVLEQGMEYILFAGLPDTPDAFGRASAVSFGLATSLAFTSEGSFVDQNGDPLNGSVFLGKPNRADHGPGGDALRTHRADSKLALEWHAMDALKTPRSGQSGFTLLEVLVAMSVLTVGLLGLAQAFYLGMQHMSTSSANLIAREKAREAVESVHTARDTRTITWAQIRNVSAGGVFVDGAQPLYAAGADGLVNTADDVSAGVETQRDPGPNGVLGDGDDVTTPLFAFRREIEIRELNPVNPDLRELVITISYTVGQQTRTYTLRTFVSAFS